MGIIAFCPNGHRIKVKDELAGRKGICPTCAARFRIPRKDATPAAAARADALERPPTARVVPLDPRAAAALPAAFSLDGADTMDAVEPPVELSDSAPDFAPVDDLAAGDEQPAAAPVVGDPPVEEAFEKSGWEPTGKAAADGPQPARAALDERPDLAWCVAVRGGAPSAPFDAAAMRNWLDSGEASADHVVWRQDWPDWRPIQEVFPEALPPRPPAWP